VFLKYLKRWKALPIETQEHAPVGVVVMPWVCTAVPWYSIMLAIGLARRGRSVVLIWDDTGFPEDLLEEQNQAIGRVLSYVGQFLPVVRLTELSPCPSRATDTHTIEAMRDHNVTWRLRGAPPTTSDLPLVDEIGTSLERSLPFVRSAVHHAGLDFLVVPGGVYGTSGLFRLAGAEQHRRVATFDADLNVAQLCVSGVASQGEDLPRAFEALWQSDAEERDAAIISARAEFQRRMEGRDQYKFQSRPAQSGAAQEDNSVLIPLNVEWDSAALGKHVHFEDTIDWLRTTVKAIRDIDAGTVIIRQHPSERRDAQRSRLAIASIVRDLFGDDPQCLFIAAEDPVNTYDLLHSARLVLPFVSTIGIEAAAIGKPVLVAGTCFYADLGFVWSAASRDEYFTLLRRGVLGDLPSRPDQTDRAWICYYLAAVQNRIWTKFTAQPSDFWAWCRQAPDALFADPDISAMLEAIDHNIPVSLLRHHRIASTRGA
jgi:hypothetical protein